jgi:predicted GNAT superfamily acetyltransferase
MTAGPTDEIAAAQINADKAAARVGVRVAELHRVAEHHAAADLLAQVWNAASPDAVMNATLLTALAHAGGYVVGAYRGDELIGVAVGFLGTGHLHSNVTGVIGTGRGVGYVLKQHQRAWCLARGIDQVRWTFDPLVARNAYFNLHRLGARAVAYLPDFYGPMSDGINAGDASDRLMVHWDLDSPAVRAAAQGPGAVRADEVVDERAGAVVLDRVGEPERPVPAAPPTDGRPRLVAVPHDVEGLRRQDRELAARWRVEVRTSLTGALDDGYRITAMSRDAFYRLQQPAEDQTRSADGRPTP